MADDAGSIPANLISQKNEFQTLSVVDASRIFSQQGSSAGVQRVILSTVFVENVKYLRQIYDSLQRLLSSPSRKLDDPLPTPDTIHAEMVDHRRTLASRNPIPKPPEMERFLILLAGTEPPFLHLWRRFVLGAAGTLNHETLIVSSIEKDNDLPSCYQGDIVYGSWKAIQSCLKQKTFPVDWDEYIGGLGSLHELNLRLGRADTILDRLYISYTPPTHRAEEYQKILKQINDRLRKQVVIPILEQLYKEKAVISFNCEDIRSRIGGLPKLPELLLFSQAQAMEARYAVVRSLLDRSEVRESLAANEMRSLSSELSRGTFSEDQFYGRLGERILETNREIPANIRDLCVEAIKLSEWQQQHSEELKRQREALLLRDTVKRVQIHENLYRVKQGGVQTIPDEALLPILQGKVGSMLGCSLPFDRFDGMGIEEAELGRYENFFIIVKDRVVTARAIDSAIAIFDKSRDAQYIRILEYILEIPEKSRDQLKDFVGPLYYDHLVAAIDRSLMSYLPIWWRLWYMITGRPIPVARRERLRRARKRHEEQKLQQFHSQSNRSSGDSNTNGSSSEGSPAVAEAVLSKADEAIFEQLLVMLDSAWQSKEYPHRDDLLAGAEEASKKSLYKLLNLIDVGAATMRKVVPLKLETFGTFYISRSHLESSRDELIDYFAHRAADDTIQIGSTTYQASASKDDKKRFAKQMKEALSQA